METVKRDMFKINNYSELLIITDFLSIKGYNWKNKYSFSLIEYNPVNIKLYDDINDYFPMYIDPFEGLWYNEPYPNSNILDFNYKNNNSILKNSEYSILIVQKFRKIHSKELSKNKYYIFKLKDYIYDLLRKVDLSNDYAFSKLSKLSLILKEVYDIIDDEM